MMLIQKIRSARGIGLLLCMQGIMPSAQADNPTTIIPLTGQVVSNTCTFNNANQTVTLGKVSPADFRDNGIKAATNFTVGITCGAGVSAVQIIPTGQADTMDSTAFTNNGSAENVGLRLLSSDGQVLTPDGSAGVSVTPSGGSGSYTFQAGYVATGNVSGGSFTSMVTLSFDYS
ncbi:fimbrial protein [Serratia fonticola]|uniref:fimbrial protein n=1 Tax=Serratia fonticola TaxID=47917 RepID=UPI0016471148|nr:fimbrial protein [Serratia fonticola]MBC3252453.1 fimbrial protein [Serratia fonticola]